MVFSVPSLEKHELYLIFSPIYFNLQSLVARCVKMPVYIDNCTSKLRGVAAEGGSGVLSLAKVKIL